MKIGDRMSADVKIFADKIEDSCKIQIDEVSKLKCFENSVIRIMPDAHAGKGCVVGFTAKVDDFIVPSLIGVDIGCGVYTTKLETPIDDFAMFDDIVRSKIPMGTNVNKSNTCDIRKLNLRCYDKLKNTRRIDKSLGTLGGGNHYIEIDENSKGDQYIVIHTGSRNLGKQICNIYQQLAIETCKEDINDDLKYLEGDNMDDYIHDMLTAESFAIMNRKKIMENISRALGVRVIDAFDTMHNYYSSDGYIRKGAICADKGKHVTIPFNMKDGAIIGVGKGNADWNNSAPHGAGRQMSRTKAKNSIQLPDFMEQMKGIYSTSVCSSTIDEAPDAYKPIDSILKYIDETVEIEEHVMPVYNAKAK